MAGTIIPLFTKREFNYDTGDRTDIVVKALDVQGYTEGMLNLRLHTSDFGVNSLMYVSLKNTAPTVEDPSQDFVGDEVASASVNSESAVPGLTTALLSSDFTGSLQVSVVGDVVSGNCNATISADLVLKE